MMSLSLLAGRKVIKLLYRHICIQYLSTGNPSRGYVNKPLDPDQILVILKSSGSAVFAEIKKKHYSTKDFHITLDILTFRSSKYVFDQPIVYGWKIPLVKMG